MSGQTSLFSVSDIGSKPMANGKEIKSSAHRIPDGKKKRVEGKENQVVSAVIGEIVPGEITQFVTKGEWSTHDLLAHILNQTGPAEVSIATWSISSPAVPHLANLIDAGLVTKLRGIFDWRLKHRCPEAEQFLRYQDADVRFGNCHAKVTVIRNDEWDITVVGSANFTNNPRIESGVIFTDRATAEFNQEWIEDEVRTGARFTDEKPGRKK